MPTDGREHAVRAARHGLALAERFDAAVHLLGVADVDAFDATLQVLSVVNIEALAAGPTAAPPTDPFEQLRERGEEATAEIADRAAEVGVETVTAVQEGFSGPAILDYADEEGMDLIAMGTHGRTGIDRILLGSTTERTIRRPPVPVMAVHPGSDES